MSTIEERLEGLRSRINTLNQEEARNDVIRERASEEQREALNTLKEEFSVSSVDEARELKKKLEKSLLENTEAVEKALDALGA